MKLPWTNGGRNKRSFLAAGALVAILLVFGVIRYARSGAKLPTATVQRKEFVEYAELRGAVKAVHSLTISAPPVGR